MLTRPKYQGFQVLIIVTTLCLVSSPAKAEDRGDSAGSASSAAGMGAMVAGAMCAFLMAKAQQTEDPTAKALYESQALQQCAQAAQSAASQQQNKDAQQALQTPTAPASETPLSASIPNTQTPASTPSTPSPTTETPTPAVTPTPDPTPVATVDPIYEPGSTGAVGANSNPKALPIGKTQLDPISGAQLGYDDQSKASLNSGASSPSSSPFGYNGMGGANSSNSQQQPKGLLDESQKAVADAGRKASQHASEAGSGGGSSEGGGRGSESDDSSINGILAQLMGQNGAGSGASLDSAGAIAQLNQGAAPGAKGFGNIFEFASYRYKQHSHETGTKALTRAPASTKRNASDLSKFATVKP